MTEPNSAPLPAADAAALRAANTAVRGTGVDTAGAVTVVADAQGGLDQVSFGAAADDLSLDELGRAVVAAAARARSKAATEAAAGVAPLLGTPTRDALLARVPGEPVEAVPEPVGRVGLNEELSVEPPAPPAPAPRPAPRRVEDDLDDEAGFVRG